MNFMQLIFLVSLSLSASALHVATQSSKINVDRATPLVAPPSRDASRRSFLSTGAGLFAGIAFADNVLAATGDVMIQELEESLEKLKPIPDLLQSNEWDKVRTILKSPPVNNLWNMGDGKNTLLNLARATDAFELIEIKDDLSINLQMCDQLTYDNVFVYFQPGNGKVKVKEPSDLANKAMSQLKQAIEIAKGN
mmetsp:Transcript_9719/g.13978  ORF Transcript_9719/g.13978 Transcript_9719/m.13978 type:complete len:194 (+) Transcript_9719:73-654(+)|eukprot:CAMPEP_0202452928 /NCGR_PEP_ID=MMETSP1360-20130828/11030_1 /ASSEMBLY_ACC=CAM_ASM_000848 /TAXON_ID=515479 /ORGANISM="Licmophora paradoxa, Strain CCMP2313" /LENGTH=193 /DNA_ID=CAMNT_0049071893 /DNA_START=63 /DNA_END=644 /DNA_ORIENTATION=+